MPVYTPPALNAVNFELSAFTPTTFVLPGTALSVYSIPALNAVNFALVVYTIPVYVRKNFELLAGLFAGILKRWNGSAWVKAKLNRFNGASQVAGNLKRWDGAAWVAVDATGV